MCESGLVVSHHVVVQYHEHPFCQLKRQYPFPPYLFSAFFSMDVIYNDECALHFPPYEITRGQIKAYAGKMRILLFSFLMMVCYE